MPYILTIAIGPVQDFIAAARKTRDLWCGSEMLSDISRAVAQAIRNERRSTHLSARNHLDDEDIAIANKIVAKLDMVVPADVVDESSQSRG